MKFIKILILIIITVSLFSCKPEEIILHGEITGMVTNASTTLPIEAAHINFSQSTDPIVTGSDGIYLIKGLVPGDYVIEATAEGFAPYPKDVTVAPAVTKESVDFALTGTSYLATSVDYLDFGLDSTQLFFTISAVGEVGMRYSILPSKKWITTDPLIGDINGELITITVTIDKTDLSPGSDKEFITIRAIDDLGFITDKTIDVYLNGVMDSDKNYYNVAQIGTQTWMAENIRVGTQVIHTINQMANGITEKYWYDDKESNYKIYGGLYQWDEMMQYNPSDNKQIGTTKGICPVGWHIPTGTEWSTLIHYLGGEFIAGGKLKEEGTEHWPSPNDATNESRFTALPGGWLDRNPHNFHDVNFFGYWWSSEEYPVSNDNAWHMDLHWDDNLSPVNQDPKQNGYSVRCVKDQDKR